MAQKMRTVNHGDGNAGRTGKMQWAALAAFVDDERYRALKGVPDRAAQPHGDVVGGSQLHQKPTITERVRAYNKAQANSLHLDLLDLGCSVTEVIGTLNGEKVSCFVVCNNSLTDTDWHDRITHLAQKYNHPAATAPPQNENHLAALTARAQNENPTKELLNALQTLLKKTA